MNLWRSFGGLVELELTSADITGALAAMNRCGIQTYRVSFPDLLTAQFSVSRKDYPYIRAATEKRGESLRILRRYGVYWRLVSAGKRPVLLIGLAAMIFLCLYMPTKVLFIQVEGNSRIPSRQILAAAEECGIRFGASRREVRSEKVKNELLSILPELQWAGINTSGCTAVISVRERAQELSDKETGGVSSLVAARDGIIISCTVTEGSAKCTVGQAVKAGQTLISGYTDCGLLLKATRAEGEIMARTRRTVLAVTMPDGMIRGEAVREERNYSLIIGKKRINFVNSSGICGTTCGRMYEEYYITLPGGFVLPVALAVDTHICFESEAFSKPGEDAFQALRAFCSEYVQSQMVSGTILNADMSARTSSDSFRLEAEYVCMEMIGQRRQERKVEINGKSD